MTSASPLERPLGPLRASPDRRHLVDAGGAPFFWLGDTAWELFHRLDRDDAVRYLDDRAAKGFTVVQAAANGRVIGDWSGAPNRYGHAPFPDGDLSRPNPAYFAHVDRVVDAALERGLRLALLPVWFGAMLVRGDRLAPDVAEEYGRFLGERYRDAGIIWTLGGDVSVVDYGFEAGPDGLRRTRPLVDHRPACDALAAGILATAGEDAFLTFHPTAGAPVGMPPLVSDYLGDRPWFALAMLQSSHMDPEPERVDSGGAAVRGADDGSDTAVSFWSGSFNYLPVGAEYRAEPTRPVLDAEPCYEDHPRILDEGPPGIWRDESIRNSAYQALFAGAAGHTYGHVSVWDFFGAGGRPDPSALFAPGFERPFWTEALDAPGARQVPHARSLMESRPWFDAVPDELLVEGDPGRGAEHIGAIRAADGSWVFVYLPRGGDVTVDLGRLSGPGPAWWFDPRTGSATRAGDHAATGSATYSAPGSGVGQDWILVLDDATRGYAEPGGTEEKGVRS